MEDDLQWKTTFNGRQPSTEGDLQQKTTLNRRLPPMGDDLKQKTTIEDKLQQKMKFSRRQPSTLGGGLEDSVKVWHFSKGPFAKKLSGNLHQV